jgi:hypothetical protein
MTGKPGTRTDIQTYWLFIPQVLFFITAMVLLAALTFSNNIVEIKRPVILLAGSVFVMFGFARYKSLSVITKIIILYIIAMFFNQLSERFVHIGLFSVHLSLIAMIPLALSFICFNVQQSQLSSVDTNDLLKSWAVVFTVVILHLLLLFILLKNIYGYGYDHNLAVLANMCLYFLVFIFSWRQLEQISVRRITALIFAVFFVVIMVRGS